MYYDVTVVQKLVIDLPRGGTKEKKIRDYLLVEGDSVTYVEGRITQLYAKNPNDWEISSVKVSKIAQVVFEKDVL